MPTLDSRFYLPSSDQRWAFPLITIVVVTAYALSKVVGRWTDHSIAVVTFLTLLAVGLFVVARLARVLVVLGSEELIVRASGAFGRPKAIRYSALVGVTKRAVGHTRTLVIEIEGGQPLVVGPWIATREKTETDLQAVVDAIQGRIAGNSER